MRNMIKIIEKFGRKARTIPQFICDVRLAHTTEEKISTIETIVCKDEVVRAEDTGRFKVGDGESRLCDLPYTDRLPETINVYRRCPSS
jgi:hypothetical protein